MTDSILVQNNKAHQIWRGLDKTAIPEFHPDIVDQIVERPDGEVNEGDNWDGSVFTPEPPPVVLTDAEKDEEAAQRFQKIGSERRAILQAFFEHENRIRVLESRSSVTIAQVYDWFKAKIRGV